MDTEKNPCCLLQMTTSCMCGLSVGSTQNRNNHNLYQVFVIPTAMGRSTYGHGKLFSQQQTSTVTIFHMTLHDSAHTLSIVIFRSQLRKTFVPRYFCAHLVLFTFCIISTYRKVLCIYQKYCAIGHVNS